MPSCGLEPTGKADLNAPPTPIVPPPLSRTIPERGGSRRCRRAARQRSTQAAALTGVSSRPSTGGNARNAADAARSARQSPGRARSTATVARAPGRGCKRFPRSSARRPAARRRNSNPTLRSSAPARPQPAAAAPPRLCGATSALEPAARRHRAGSSAIHPELGIAYRSSSVSLLANPIGGRIPRAFPYLELSTAAPIDSVRRITNHAPTTNLRHRTGAASPSVHPTRAMGELRAAARRCRPPTRRVGPE